MPVAVKIGMPTICGDKMQIGARAAQAHQYPAFAFTLKQIMLHVKVESNIASVFSLCKWENHVFLNFFAKKINF